MQQAAAESPAGARLQRLLHNGSLLRAPGGLSASQLAAVTASQQAALAPAAAPQHALAAERHEAATATQQGVLLAALAAATGAHDAAHLQYAEVVRAKMLRHGLLTRLAELLRRLCCGAGGGSGAAAGGGNGAPGGGEAGGGGKGGRRAQQQQQQPSQAAPAAGAAQIAVDGAAVVSNAWLVGSVLLVMENATFTAPENAACLASASFDSADGGDGGNGEAAGAGAGASGSGAALPSLLVALLDPLCGAALGGSAACAQCLHGCLAVLMNLTHGNTAGGVGAITRAGGVAAISDLLRRLLPSWERGPAGALRAEVGRAAACGTGAWARRCWFLRSGFLNPPFPPKGPLQPQQGPPPNFDHPPPNSTGLARCWSTWR